MAIEQPYGRHTPGGKTTATAYLSRAHKHLERLRITLDQHAIVATTDADGRITYANEKFCELSGYSPEELLGQDHRLVNSGYHPKAFFEDMWRTIGQGRVWRGEIRNRAKDGRCYWVASTIVPFTDESGRIIEYMAIRTEITEHKKTQQRLAEMYDTAHQFVDHVSHEFRTPLTVIKEFASIILDGLAGATNSEQREYLEIIVNRVDDLSVLVDDMLDTSKLEAGLLGIARADCQIEQIVERVRTTLERKASAARARLEIDIPPDQPAVYCDAEKIGRVITNLVVNALKFCGENGLVTLRSTVDASQHAVTVSVIDNGPGIAPENLEALFQRFRQIGGPARSGLSGFGLGLSIAKELVTLNFGDITVESKPGSGSTFSFTVPFADRRSLLRRYLHRVEDLRAGSACVTLIRLTSDPDAAAESLDELEHLVQCDTRRSDLLFRTAPHRWLLVAAANQEDLQPLIERVQRARAESSRSRIGEILPRLTLESVGSWSVDEESGVFVESFMAAESPPETTFG